MARESICESSSSSGDDNQGLVGGGGRRRGGRGELLSLLNDGGEGFGGVKGVEGHSRGGERSRGGRGREVGPGEVVGGGGVEVGFEDGKGVGLEFWREKGRRKTKSQLRFQGTRRGRRKSERGTNSSTYSHLVLIHRSFVILDVRSVRRRGSERFVNSVSVLDDSNDGGRDS